LYSETYEIEQEYAANIYVSLPISRPTENKEKAISDFINALNLQLKLHYHACVHPLFYIDFFFDTPYIQSRKYFENLDQVIQKNELSMLQKISMIIYIIMGLGHSYKRGVHCHQDLQPSNIFTRDYIFCFDDLENFKKINKTADISDFVIETNHNKNFAYPYMAPEQFLSERLSAKTDVFALGVIAFELFNQAYHPIGIKTNAWWPKPKDNNPDLYCNSKKWEEWVDQKCPINKSNIESNTINDFIFSMLSYDPSDRPDLAQCKLFFIKKLKEEDELAMKYFDILRKKNQK